MDSKAKTTALSVVLLLASWQTFAQSFDCRRATTAAEHLICADPELGGMDARLSTMYSTALALNPSQRQRITFAQRDFMARRDACTRTRATMEDTSSCMKDEYSSQGDYLNVLAGGNPNIRPF